MIELICRRVNAKSTSKVGRSDPLFPSSNRGPTINKLSVIPGLRMRCLAFVTDRIARSYISGSSLMLRSTKQNYQEHALNPPPWRLLSAFMASRPVIFVTNSSIINTACKGRRINGIVGIIKAAMTKLTGSESAGLWSRYQ